MDSTPGPDDDQPSGPAPETFEAYAAAGNRVCVLFTAKWCVAGGILERQLAGEALGAPMVTVDVDAYPHLADRFRIQSLPAALLLCGGERGRLIGAFGPSQVKALTARGAAADTADLDTPASPARRRR